MTKEFYNLPLDDIMPNNPDLPVLVYRDIAPDSKDLAGFFKDAFEQNGWRGSWRNGIYDYHHYHSNAHEVLGIAKGQVAVRLGGPTGLLLHLVAGDCVILPAGAGHCRIDATSDLLVVGAYPPGQENPDIQRSWQDKTGVRNDIRHVAVPEYNPLSGFAEGAETLWTGQTPDFLDSPATPVSYTSSQSGFGTRSIN